MTSTLSSERPPASNWFELIVEGIAGAIIVADKNRQITLVNRNAEALFGYTRDELIGQRLELLVPHRFQQQHPDHVKSFFASPQARAMGAGRDLFGLRKDGVEVPIEIGLNPIETPAGLFTVASIVDISERKRAEDELRRSNAQLEKVNEDLDNFVYTASHDLCSPLAGVSTVAGWILQDDDTLSPQTRERLALIQARIARMTRLLNDIRDYARTGRYAEPSATPMSAAALVADIAATSPVPAGFSVQGDSSLDTVQVYRVPLEQILHNLINNAIKHHDRDAGTVTISVARHGQKLRFSVTDDGPGVPAEYREAIFDMFRTLKPRDEKEGSGMGLALVRKIVGRMGGACGMEPADNRGANFWFDWPKVV